MSINYLTINEGDMMPVANVKRVLLVDESDRQWLENNTSLSDPSQYQTKIETAAGKSFVRQSITELAQQGMAFVQVTDQAYVPAGNIIKARNLTPKDFERFQKNTGRELSTEFKSQVDTNAGNILSTFTAQQIMQRMEHPLKATQQHDQNKPEGAALKM